MRTKLCACLVSVCLALFAHTASAQDYRLPPSQDKAGEGIQLTDWFRVKPFARLHTYYTSNLFQEPNRRKEGDTVIQATGGTDILLGDPEGAFFEFGYAGTQLMFVKNPKENTVEHRVRYNTEIQLSKSLEFSSSGSGTWGASNTDPQFSGRVRNFNGFGTTELTFRPVDTFGIRADFSMAYSENFPRVFHPSNSLTSRAGLFLVLSPNLPGDLQFEFGSNWRQIHYVDRLATNPDLELISGQVGARMKNDIVSLRVRGGYEDGYVKKRNAFPRHHSGTNTLGDTVSDGFFGSGSVTLTPNQTTTFTVFGGHSIKDTSNAFYQRNTSASAVIKQQIPPVEGLFLFAGANWGRQDARHGFTQRTQSYKAGFGFSPVDFLEIGGQGSYLRSSSRPGGFETFEGGLQLTLKI